MNREFRPLWGLVLALALAACADKGTVNIGDGQHAGGGGGGSTDYAIAYIKRTLPTDPADLDAMRAKDALRRYRRYLSKADVYIRERADESSPEHNITAAITGSDFYDIKDLDVSADGTRLVFAMRGPLQQGQQDFDPPNWRIWEYDVAAGSLQSITDDVTASEGQDISPHYLPADSAHPYGRILISSTRQRDSKFVLLTEGKPGFEAQSEDISESAFNLTVLDPTQTGPSAFAQISVNTSHDINPTVLADGRILYTRWAHRERGRSNGMHLYTINPDGTNQQLLFGAHSHDIGTVDPATGQPTNVQFVKARQMQDGRIMAIIRPTNSGTDFGGNLVMIDVNTYAECLQRTAAAGGPVPPGANPCPALAPATPNDVRTIPGPSPGGRFNSAYPLWDGTGRVLVSWTQCRLLDASGTIVPCTDANLAANLPIAPPLYSAWLLNPGNNTFKPVVAPTEGVMLTDIVTLQARNPPSYIAPLGGSALAGDNVGIIDIRSIYDWADATNPFALGTETNAQTIARLSVTPADSRRARFLRLIKIVSLGDPRLNDGFPDFDRNIALDHSPGYMREIVGYTPIEADGSVRVKVPANISFKLEVTDARGHRLSAFPQHRTWQQLRPGEVVQCNGCHNNSTPTSTTTHGRPDLFASIYPGDASGKTMAQQLYGTSTDCAAAPCDAATPSVDVVYVGSGAPGDTSIDLAYSKLSTPSPAVPTTCENSWSAVCRITTNYAASAPGAANTSPAHIDPLWTLDRAANTCVNCHTATRTQVVSCTPAGTTTPVNVTLGIPAAGGLELDPDPAQLPTQQLRAYVQLVSTHTTTTFSLDSACVQVSTGAQVAGSIIPGSAAASLFFSVVTGNVVGTVNHRAYMTASELRLVAEWVDVGAQYYNNPFAAPLN